MRRRGSRLQEKLKLERTRRLERIRRMQVAGVPVSEIARVE